MNSLPTSLAILALAIAPLAAEEPKQPNILFIFSDDHALQAITAYGKSRYADHFQTPPPSITLALCASPTPIHPFPTSNT